MDISKAWGYGAVVVPKRLFWQGFVILDPADSRIHAHVAKALTNAEVMNAETTPPEGTISASLVHAMLVLKDDFAVAVFAAALSEVIGHRFWVVDADLHQDGGVVTQVSTLKEASTPEAAREEIDRRVMPLKMGHVLRMVKKSPNPEGSANPPADPEKDQGGKR